ncbi:CMP/dCMP kinase [Anaerolineae bacterium]|nr:CMP/dCMP kinase [Anaerolineae bacterium]
MIQPRIVALDGPAGAGKTTVGSEVARRLGYLFVDTGQFYRAVTWLAIHTGMINADEESLTALARNANFELRPTGDGSVYRVLYQTQDITDALREKGLERKVSKIAAVAGVRAALTPKYRELATAHPKIIMAGRDIGTVVLPDADLKIYLDATLDIRAERRHQQSQLEGRLTNIEDTRNAVADRDKQDSERAVAPLRPADDAVHINTDHLSKEAVIDQVMAVIRAWKPASATIGEVH